MSGDIIPEVDALRHLAYTLENHGVCPESPLGRALVAVQDARLVAGRSRTVTDGLDPCDHGQEPTACPACRSPDAISATFALEFGAMSGVAHANSREKGFWPPRVADANQGEKIALMHSELSELLEAVREDDPPSEKIPGFSSSEEELADVVIRVGDYAAAHGLDVGGAILAKHAYNRGRPTKHGKAF